MFQRIKQFYWDITSKFKSIDREFVNRYLYDEDKVLFYQLKKAEQHHVIRVAKNAKNKINELITNVDENKFMRICLLHDVGKIGGDLTVIDRSILVLANKLTKGKIKKYTNINKIYVYYNHAHIGADLLKKKGYDEDFVKTIRYHHSEGYSRDIMLNILREVDDIS